MRRLLGVMREDADAEAARDPQQSLARLNELVETARAAGTPMALTLHGAVATLPPGVDSARRILQELSRTFAGMRPVQPWTSSSCTRPMRYVFASAITGRARISTHLEGHGLLGMRERAIMVGGTLSAGPADGGGFAVEAGSRSEGCMTIRVVVVDDQEIVRAGFAARCCSARRPTFESWALPPTARRPSSSAGPSVRTSS